MIAQSCQQIESRNENPVRNFEECYTGQAGDDYEGNGGFGDHESGEV
jgi:hypothetical protein